MLLVLCSFGIASAQFSNPVKVNVTFDKKSDTEAVLKFVASIENGWHMYSTQVVADGPTPTTINIEKISGAKLDGALAPAAAPIKKYEDMFEADVYFFERSATFVQKVKLLGGKYEIEGYLEYGACNDQNCIPPTPADFKFAGQVAQQVKKTADEAPADKAQEKASEEMET